VLPVLFGLKHGMARGALLVLGVVLLASPALGKAHPPNPARLQYELPVALAASCPGESVFRNVVAALLNGQDPFTDAATPKLVTVKLSRNKQSFVAVVSLYEAGELRGKSEEIAEARCESLVEDAGRAAALWLVHFEPDAPVPPLAACAPAPSAPACPKLPPEPPEPAELPPAEPVKPAPAVVPVRAPIVWRLGAGAWVDFGLAPQPLVGVKVDGEFKLGRFSLMGSLRWDPTTSVTAQNGFAYGMSVSTRLLAGGLTGCVHGEWHASFAGCVVGEVGQIQRTLEDEAYTNLPQAALYAGGGAGVRVEIPLRAHLDVQVAADLLGATKLASGTGISSPGGGNPNTGNVAGFAGGFGAGLGVTF
jgi:hypothetical protein